MKKIKIADTFIQLLLLLYFSFEALFHFRAAQLFIGFCIVSGWQLISRLFYALRRDTPQLHRHRRFYDRLLLILLISACLIPFLWIIIPTIWVILIPCMVIYYWLISFNEIRLYQKRPLAYLK